MGLREFQSFGGGSCLPLFCAMQAAMMARGFEVEGLERTTKGAP